MQTPFGSARAFGAFVVLLCAGIAAGEDQAGGTTAVSKEYYKSGRLRQEVPMKDGNMHGLAKWYYESGVPQKECGYENGKKHGMEITYYPDGVVRSSLRYEKGKELEGSRNGVFLGAVRGGNYPGSMYPVTPYRDGVKHGQEYWFYWNGSECDFTRDEVAMVRPWVNGQIHGTEVTYAGKDGRIGRAVGCAMRVSEFCNSLSHGKEKEFAANGQLILESTWVCGMLHGPEREYREDRKLKRETEWKLNEKHGKEVLYDAEGKVQKVTYWDRGKETEPPRGGEGNDAGKNGKEAQARDGEPKGEAPK
jgi:antitoxin component YwqK of YwqJK toxin-antitoxin module